MPNSNLSYRCYILPLVAAIVYYILSLPLIVKIFDDWIPDYQYCIVMKAILLLFILFFVCRILDILWSDPCHDQICTNGLTCSSFNTLNNNFNNHNSIPIPDIISLPDIIPQDNIIFQSDTISDSISNTISDSDSISNTISDSISDSDSISNTISNTIFISDSISNSIFISDSISNSNSIQYSSQDNILDSSQDNILDSSQDNILDSGHKHNSDISSKICFDKNHFDIVFII